MHFRKSERCIYIYILCSLKRITVLSVVCYRHRRIQLTDVTRQPRVSKDVPFMNYSVYIGLVATSYISLEVEMRRFYEWQTRVIKSLNCCRRRDRGHYVYGLSVRLCVRPGILRPACRRLLVESVGIIMLQRTLNVFPGRTQRRRQVIVEIIMAWATKKLMDGTVIWII